MKKRYITPKTDISVMTANENILLLSTEKVYGASVEYNDDRWSSSALDVQ